MGPHRAVDAGICGVPPPPGWKVLAECPEHLSDSAAGFCFSSKMPSYLMTDSQTAVLCVSG